MGDRALVQIVNEDNTVFSPVLYLHWHGECVPAIIGELRSVMRGRYNDVEYSFARLVQLAANQTNSTNLSVGCWNTDHILTVDDSHGDAGCIVVNCSTWTVETRGGYLTEKAYWEFYDPDNHDPV